MLLGNHQTTCLVDIPLRVESNNVLLAFHAADNFEICKREATSLADKNPEAKYFFWSSHSNPLGNSITTNCYVFKSCKENERVSLKFPGNTYKHLSGNSYINKVISVS